ncbi:MAG: AsmA family protein, partial [Bacteroidetes bacterium]|nr:AsmA family protein [Bacteroidota bacterium]
MADDASSSPDPRDADPTSTTGSGPLRWLLYGLGGLIGLVLLAAVVLPWVFPPERLKRIVVPQVEQAVQRDVTVGSIGLRVLPFPAIRITDYTVANDSSFQASGAFPDDPAVEGDALNIDLALWPLFTGTIEPTTIELVRPVVRYQVAEDGTTNFDSFAATDDAPADTTGDALPIAVSDVRLREARVLYDDRSTGQWAELGFDGQVRAVPGADPDAIDSSGRLEGITLAYLSAPDADTTSMQNAAVDYDLLVNSSAGSVDLRRFDVSTPPVGLVTSGSLSNLNSDRPRVDLSIETADADLAQLAAIVPGGVGEGVAPRGTMNLSVVMKGPLPDSTGSTDGLTLTGEGSLSGIGVDVDGTTMLADLGADLSVSLDSIAVNAIEGRLLGKPLSGRLTVREPLAEAPQLDGQLAGAADLAELSSVAAEEGSAPVDIAGTVDYDLRFAGPATDTDAIRVRGPIRMANIVLPNESLREPLEIDNATVQFTGTGLQADRFALRSGEATMELAFTARSLLPLSDALAETNPALQISFDFSADTIDLVQLMPEEDASAPTYADLFTAQLAGTSVNGRSAEEVAREAYGGVELPAFRVDGDVSIGTLLNEPQRFDNLTFDVSLQNRRLSVPNLSAGLYGGTLAGSIVLDQSAAAAS